VAIKATVWCFGMAFTIFWPQPYQPYQTSLDDDELQAHSIAIHITSKGLLDLWTQVVEIYKSFTTNECRLN